MKQVLAEFFFRDSVDKAIRQLSAAQFNMKNLAILAKGFHVKDQPAGVIDADDYLLVWKQFLKMCGSTWETPSSPTVIFVPEVGCVFFAGWLVSAIRAGLNSAAFEHALGPVGGVLASVGVSRRQAIVCEGAVREGRFLIIVRGSTIETELALSILAPLGATGLDISDHRQVA